MTKKDNLVIVGSSGHARVVIDAIEKEGRFTIIGLIDKFREIGEQEMSYPILGAEEDLPRLIEQYGIGSVFVAIGDNHVRSAVASKIGDLCPELIFASVVHPNAEVASKVKIGEGTVLLSGVTVNPFAKIGRFCILNTNSSLDHDSELADFSSLAPNAVTGGNCNVGEGSAIGIGAVLIHGVTIGKHTVVGAGSLVLESVDDFVVAYGSPAKAISSRSEGDKYL